jgi:hypothetical protein
MRPQLTAAQEALLRRFGEMDLEDDKSLREAAATALVGGEIDAQLGALIPLFCRQKVDENDLLYEGAWNLKIGLEYIEQDMTEEEQVGLGLTDEVFSSLAVPIINAVDSLPEQLARLGLMSEDRRPGEAWDIIAGTLSEDTRTPREDVEAAMSSDDGEIATGARLIVGYCREMKEGFVAEDEDQAGYLAAMEAVAAI